MTPAGRTLEELAAAMDVTTRVAWAILKGLEKAGLVERPARGLFCLTPEAERRYGAVFRSLEQPRIGEGT